MDEFDVDMETAPARLLRPVLLATLAVLVVFTGMVFSSIAEIDDRAAEIDMQRARALIAAHADLPPSGVAEKLTGAGYADVRVVTDDTAPGIRHTLPLVTAEGLRRGTIAFSPHRPGREIFFGTLSYKGGLAALSLVLLVVALSRLRRQTRDIERRRVAARAAALTDQLSGLPNRRAFRTNLVEALGAAEKGNLPMALYFIDIDNFKAINDSHGHAAGDAVIELVAEKLKAAMRPGDAVARLSGDEFAMIRSGAGTPAAARAFGHALVGLFALPVTFSGMELEITVSVGIALAPPGTEQDLSEICRRADNALYAAKAKGRNCAVLAEDMPAPAAVKAS